MQSERLHVGIIMDGNGRWAQARGLPRHAGHEAGVETIRRIVESAPSYGVATMTMYAFSSGNWSRPEAEVACLMDLLRLYLRNEASLLARTDTRLSVIGRRDRLPPGLADEIGHAEVATAGGRKLHLRIAIDYSGREAILTAVQEVRGTSDLTREAFSSLVTGDPAVGDVDLVIRTSGEKRLSDFLLWESAYAELHFTDRMWPDFSEEDLAEAIATFHSRERRFGGLRVAQHASRDRHPEPILPPSFGKLAKQALCTR